MLVLSRKTGETLVIGGNIRVTIIEIRDNKVRIGIDAPKEISVHRLEVHDAIEASRIGVVEDSADDC